MFKILTKRNAA